MACSCGRQNASDPCARCRSEQALEDAHGVPADHDSIDDRGGEDGE